MTGTVEKTMVQTTNFIVAEKARSLFNNRL
jgi:hypothetical protein